MHAIVPELLELRADRDLVDVPMGDVFFTFMEVGGVVETRSKRLVPPQSLHS